MADIDFKVLWGPLKRLVDMLDGTYAERVVSQPPAFLLSGTTKQRLRVDVGEPGFFEGRQFRTFREFSIAAGATLTLRFVTPVNIILLSQGLEIDSGSLRVQNISGGTPGGTFAEALPIIAQNTMSERPTPIYASQMVVTAGGTVTGGTVLDNHRAVAATATAQQTTVGSTVGDSRGIGANTYYVTYQNFGGNTATGTLFYRWEERV